MSIEASIPSASHAAGRLVAAALAFLLGAVLIYGAAFSPIPALHDTAHDTRHGLSFPCH